MPRLANHQAGGIFLERDISAEVQTGFDAPVLVQQVDQLFRAGFLSRQAREAIDDFADLTFVFGMTDGLLQTEDLST
jgi:hypothetical protein